MSVAIDIRDQTKAALDELKDVAQPPNINDAVGRAATNLFREHFFLLDAQRANKIGGDRSHFYGDAARRTNYTVLADAALVSIDKLGIAQRRFGGEIHAGANPSCKTSAPTKYLTIPAASEAYGRAACEFTGLKLMLRRMGGVVRAVGLEATEESEAPKAPKRIREGIARRAELAGERELLSSVAERQVIFWLVPMVNQRPDESVLPTDAQITGAALGAIKMLVERVRRKGGAA